MLDNRNEFSYPVFMKHLIEKYLESKKNAWTESSLRSERARLNAVQHVLDNNPGSLWADLEQRCKPYARVSYFGRVTNFIEWCIEEGHLSGPNLYKKWRRDNARLFKHTYQSRHPRIDFAEAKRRIESIENPQIREKCLQLLEGGLRYSESYTVDSEGCITGKGGKRRRIFTERDGQCSYSYRTIVRHLARLELRPHDLRKIRATDLRRQGLADEDLMKVFGWNSMETAKRYLAPLKDEELKKVMNVS